MMLTNITNVINPVTYKIILKMMTSNISNNVINQPEKNLQLILIVIPLSMIQFPQIPVKEIFVFYAVV